MSKELAKQKANEFLTQNIDLSENTGSGIAKHTIYKYTQEQVNELIDISATSDIDLLVAFCKFHFMRFNVNCKDDAIEYLINPFIKSNKA